MRMWDELHGGFFAILRERVWPWIFSPRWLEWWLRWRAYRFSSLGFRSESELSLTVLALLTGSTAIMCYHCNSAYDPRCADPFNAFSIGMINCSTQPPTEHMIQSQLNATLCRKTTQKGMLRWLELWPSSVFIFVVLVYGVVRVVRGCGYITDDRDDKDCMKRSGTHDVHALYCACTSDLCNKSSQLFHQHQITFAILILPFMYLLNQRFTRQL